MHHIATLITSVALSCASGAVLAQGTWKPATQAKNKGDAVEAIGIVVNGTNIPPACKVGYSMAWSDYGTTCPATIANVAGTNLSLITIGLNGGFYATLAPTMGIPANSSYGVYGWCNGGNIWAASVCTKD